MPFHILPTSQFLLDNAPMIAAIDPDQHAIPYTADKWAQYFQGEPYWQDIQQNHPLQITRGDLRVMAQALLQPFQINGIYELFLGSMIWGYGTVGYGPYRTSLMFQTQGLNQTLTAICDLLSHGQFLDAYRRSDIDFCGPAFFTKFFYFFGLGVQGAQDALILDSVIAKRFEETLQVPIAQFAKVARNPNTGRISAIQRFPEGYVCYLRNMQSWAQQLHVRADAIELFLFGLEDE